MYKKTIVFLTAISSLSYCASNSKFDAQTKSAALSATSTSALAASSSAAAAAAAATTSTTTSSASSASSKDKKISKQKATTAKANNAKKASAAASSKTSAASKASAAKDTAAKTATRIPFKSLLPFSIQYDDSTRDAAEELYDALGGVYMAMSASLDFDNGVHRKEITCMTTKSASEIKLIVNNRNQKNELPFLMVPALGIGV